MGQENVQPQDELDRLDAQVNGAVDLATLKPILIRLNEILQNFPDDFNVQINGAAITQRLLERGNQLSQPGDSPVPPPGPATPVAVNASAPPITPSGEETLLLPTVRLDLPRPVPPAPISPAMASTSEETLLLPPTPIVSARWDPPKTALTLPPEIPRQPPPRPPAPPPVPPRRRNPVAVIGALGGLLLVGAVTFLVVGRTGNRDSKTAATVQLDIVTTPAGAAVTVTPGAAAGGVPANCTSNCKFALTPGTYQISASLDGFEPVSSAVAVMAGQPAPVSLTLTPLAQSVRVLTDLAQGKVVVDDQPPVDLQEGQLVLDKVAPGTHTVKVTGASGEASFAFAVADARPPAVAGPVTARDMIAVLVASFGKQARVVTNAGPWKLTVNGQPQSDASPAGTDLTGFQPGVNEIVVGKDQDQRNMSETFGAAPMLTAFLKTDVNAGTLIVSTGQDDVRVFLNGKEYGRRTRRGQLRLPTLGKVTVRVAKGGFQDEPPQTVEVKKGAEARVQFALKQQPQFGSLHIQGAPAGTEVLIDQKNVGPVGPDGSATFGSIQPGDHAIELRRDRYTPKRLQRTFRAGQPVLLDGADVALTAAFATVQFTRNPASTTITYRRGDETELHAPRGNQVELPPGAYTFWARAPGFADEAIHLQLAAGESREVDFALARERPTAPASPATSGMTEFEDAQGWKNEGGSWSHKGGGFVPYKLPPKGVFTFTVQLLKGGGVFRAGQIRWCLQYLDSKNYLLYEMDRKNFWAGVVEKGKRLERVKTPHSLANQKAFTIQIEVTPDRVVQKVRVADEWKVLDTFAEPGRDFTQGKFGFLIQGNDEIGISDFKFVPK